ncbi:hypothetical protein BCR24_03800 [Enterococcus ureilyticus]|uniref:ABC-2 type transporter transmembrane domain-containing protein n=1 Tax=Enterococcus ureilyticus TaxID=1131292 RepID=A0A1E5HBQ4_9ENTE|nr:ABC transporter permease [Enterococcus ureilyticus]MBM7689199.1 ABC-2 type transport system permease protein [Enterococcus ureilyticus]OEG22265.1 hypothetical protein BCR24_03800 [Enterococcus ureilyticus]
MNTLIVLTKTDLNRSLVRSKPFIFFSLGMPVGFYLLFTKVFNMGVSTEYMAVFYKESMIQMATYSVMISSLFSFSMTLIEDRKQGVKQFLRLSPIPESIYYASKVVTQFLINSLLLSVIFLVGHFVNGVQMPVIAWLTSAVWILYGCLPIVALATIVSLVKDPNTVSVLNNMILMPLAIVSGLWWPINMFPEVIQKIAAGLPTFYAAQGAKQLAEGQLPDGKGIVIIFIYFVGIMVLSIYLNGRKEEVKR